MYILGPNVDLFGYKIWNEDLSILLFTTAEWEYSAYCSALIPPSQRIAKATINAMATNCASDAFG